MLTLMYRLWSCISRFQITVFNDLQMARNSWNLVSPSAIANCFKRAELIPPSTSFEEVVESESFSSFETDFYVDCIFDEYKSSDSHLQCSPMLSSADIIASLQQSTEDAEDSDDDTLSYFPSSPLRFLRCKSLPAMCREWH